ncbi:hypothetical protein [Burkholderia phage FLC9]|nr:hypothetical protein [Burkholderia phage FLC9]
MNFDQERAADDRGNLVLSVGILGGWASLIRSQSSLIGPEDRATLPYIARAYAVARDIVSGTPDANTSIYTCDIADSDLGDKLLPYMVVVMRNPAARDRGVPTALQRVVDYLKKQAPL